jgi:hypothetical protein
MDTSVQQQAALDGALLRITLRQLLAPIAISLSAVTILATQEFSFTNQPESPWSPPKCAWFSTRGRSAR